MPSHDAPRATPAGTNVAEGRLLGDRYRLDALLATGGMAQVWRGTDEVLQRQVAVKLLHSHLAADDSFVARFRLEAVAAARLAHPGIVSIYDTCSEDGIEAIVMELVPGMTLRERLDDPTPVDPWQAASLAAQVAEALDAAHRAGLVHRDIKPANVLLCGDGRVKVADFGIAKAMAETDLTQPGLMVGTAKYVAPEQVRGEPVDPRTDIYSLGVVLYEMLCGRPPFASETDAATALARLQRDPLRPRQVRPSVPKDLEQVVWRAMAREPDDRYGSAADLRAALIASGAPAAPDPDLTATSYIPAPAGPPEGVTRTTAAPGHQPPAPDRAPSFRQTERSWLVPTLLVVAVAVALGVAGLLIGRSGAGNLLGEVRDAIGGRPAPAPVAISAARAFDPPCDASLCTGSQRGGDGREHDDSAANAHDGNPETAWRTEGYNQRDITALKPGVGLVVELEAVKDLSTLEIISPTNDWHAVVYVAESDPGTLPGWGEPVTTAAGIAGGTSRIDLGGARGGAVLLWITDRGDGRGSDSVEIREVSVTGR